jgi:hypothetical protein
MDKFKYFALEYNEEQQCFHHNYGQHPTEKNEWFTIFENCTDLEFQVYEAFVNRVPKKKITKDYLLKCAVEIKGFMSNLLEYGLVVSKINK